MYVCIRMYVYVCMHVCVYCMYVYMYACMLVVCMYYIHYMYVCIPNPKCMYIFMSGAPCMYVCMYVLRKYDACTTNGHTVCMYVCTVCMCVLPIGDYSFLRLSGL